MDNSKINKLVDYNVTQFKESRSDEIVVIINELFESAESIIQDRKENAEKEVVSIEESLMTLRKRSPAPVKYYMDSAE